MEFALNSSISFYEYTTTLFDNFIDRDIALLCSWGDYGNDDCDDGNVRACLPMEAMTIFLGKTQFPFTFLLFLLRFLFIRSLLFGCRYLFQG